MNNIIKNICILNVSFSWVTRTALCLHLLSTGGKLVVGMVDRQLTLFDHRIQGNLVPKAWQRLVKLQGRNGYIECLENEVKKKRACSC